MSEINTASVLSFERKLDPSDGLFYAGNWNDRENKQGWTPITVREKAVRGTVSNRLKAKDQDPAKLNAAIENANLQTVDVTTLPNNCDTLKVHFTLRVLGGVGNPNACNNAAYKDKLLKTVQNYVQAYGFKELAHRYAYNLANGRFLWRNRLGAEDVEIRIQHYIKGESSKTWIFDAFKLSWRDFESTGEIKSNLETLSQVIENGLYGESYVLLDIEAYVRVGKGQEIFPSQELILDKGNKKGKKSKTLYKVNEIAAMHSQKIGNAIRTIDTWYPNQENQMPIAVEPYGSVTALGKAYRPPKEKFDFYNLFDKWVINDKEPTVEHQHFVIANLIRGGVFGESENKKEG